MCDWLARRFAAPRRIGSGVHLFVTFVFLRDFVMNRCALRSSVSSVVFVF